jgi:signal transduction histidine kinase
MKPLHDRALLDRPAATRSRAAAPARRHSSHLPPAGRHPSDLTPAALTAGAEDIATAVSEALQRERARTRAWLHDTVLQVLELLAAGGYADQPDPHAMAGTAAHAADELRAEIEGELHRPPGTLIEQIRTVVERERMLAAHEIRLEAGVIEPVPAVPGNAELAAAAAEALRNARKHASATRVTVTCEVFNGLATVVVADDGAGFDPATVRRDTGLRQSIVGRLEDQGGNATIDSSPGAGTRVSLQLRLAQRKAACAARGSRR